MLPKKNRVDKKTIEKIFKEGRFINSRNLTFKYIASPVTRVSFLTPKTVSKKSVARNLLRRRGYSVFKKYSVLTPPLAGVFVFGKNSVVVFGGKKNTKHNPFLNLENEIKYILEKYERISN